MKPERRSMTAALQSAADLPPEAIALIKAGTPKPLSATLPVIPSEPEAVAPAPALPEAESPKGEPPIREDSTPSSEYPRKVRGRPKGSVSRPVEAFGRLVGTSYRLPEELIFKVMKASAERKIRKIHPWAQQDIVAEAVNAWLKAEGY